jgi:hypothetical protein
LSAVVASDARVRSCRTCAHFENDPRRLEAAFPGWNAMGSAWGSTRSDDGLCELRAIYLSADGTCAQHCPRGALLRR